MKQESMGAANPAFSTRHSLHWGEKPTMKCWLVRILSFTCDCWYHHFNCTMAIVASYLSIVMQNMMIFSINNSWLVVFRPTPLKNDRTESQLG